MKNKTYRSTRSTLYAAAGIVIALAGVAAAGMLLLRSCRRETASVSEKTPVQRIEYDAAAVEGGWETLTQEQIEAVLNEKVAEGMINISCNTTPYFETGTSKGSVMLVNESVNRYPQMVEYIRNDTQEVIYTSKAIPVGSKIERAALDVDLPAGTYACTALFHNLDPETGEIIGTAGAVITVTVNQ